MKKYYRVIKENFLYEVGAILHNEANGGNGYVPIDDVFYVPEKTNEYISASIIETMPNYFERVYPVNLLSKVVYKAKEEAKEILAKGYTE